MCQITSLVNQCITVQPGTEAMLLMIEAGQLSNKPKTVKEVGLASNTTPPYVPLNGDGVAYGEPFTYTSNASYWKRIPVVFDMSNINAKSEGDTGFSTFSNKLPFTLKGTDDEVREFLEKMMCASDCEGIVIAIATKQEPNKVQVLGDIYNPARAQLTSLDTGKKTGDKSLAEVEITFNANTLWRSYARILGIRLNPVP